MHVEIQVALNFLISFLYNKLPRRRVNQFGEELENALKMKFEGHWYPDKPYKGSAFRCLKTTPPLDPVFEIAAREAGMDLSDIQENLAPELSIWIDPGEVSYRMSEKGPVKILYSESDRNIESEHPDREVTRTFNPEAQCFKPIDSMANQFGSLTLSPSMNGTPPSPFGLSPPVYKPCNQAPIGFNGKTPNPVTFTTAMFAQTKFGSTKLKTNGKRSHRMSPTEFSNYIKQKALIQQQQQAQNVIGSGMPIPSNTYAAAAGTNGSPHTSRSISPVSSQLDSVNNFMLMAVGNCNSTIASPSSPSSFGSSQSHFSTNLASPSTSRFSSGTYDSNSLSDIFGSSLGKSPTQPQQQQQQQQLSPIQGNSLSRFASFLDKASPYISSPSKGNTTGISSPTNGLNMNYSAFGDECLAISPNNNSNSSINNNNNSNNNNNNVINNINNNNNNNSSNAAKTFDNFNFNLNGVTYPNQYQHLLVAN